MRDFHPQLSLLWGSGGRMFLATMSQTSIMDPKTADNSCERWPASVQMLCWAGSCCFDKLTPGQNPRIWMGSSLPGRTKCTLCLVEAISLQLTRHGYGTPSIFYIISWGPGSSTSAPPTWSKSGVRTTTCGRGGARDTTVLGFELLENRCQ